MESEGFYGLTIVNVDVMGTDGPTFGFAFVPSELDGNSTIPSGLTFKGPV
ncbi:hypothetical protein [Gimesia maris]